MAGEKMRGLKFQDNSWWVRVTIPADVRHAFGGQGSFWDNLHTSNPHDAMKMGQPIRAQRKRLIADARAGKSPGETTVDDARQALARRKASWKTPAPGLMMTVEQAQRLVMLDAVAKSPDGWRSIPDFDQTVADIIGSNRRVDPSEPIVAKMREEVAVHLGEEVRQFPPSGAAKRVLIVAQQEAAARPLLPPSIRLRVLYDQWKATLSVSDKELGRLDHQIRRLIEVVHDKPANHLTKGEVRDFMTLVARFPGRKRSPALNALPMLTLIETFEADVAAIKARNATRKPGERLEDVPGTLTVTTVDEWFGGYRRMFEYAVDMDIMDRHPFESRIKRHAVKGAEPVKKREFTENEIKAIFSAPMFNGFDGEGERGYRNRAGGNIVRDAKYWLPILGLFHGGRLTEFAAMPHADLKRSPAGSWYFDLTDRQVKNESSQRLIPLHPSMIDLGFLDYVSNVRTGNSPWLFPDLNHETKHGPGHAFSKWWGHWMDKHGLSDPTITHHSWRHTWKRAARESDVKEEMHDIISGHTNASVGRSYGGGADIEALAREMARIKFPAFPEIPVVPVERRRPESGCA